MDTGTHARMVRSAFVTQVQLENYMSIARCDVALRPLTFLVGANGSGKSNFIDSLHFVADALRNSIEHALSKRGGFDQVRRRTPTGSSHLSIGLNLRLPHDVRARYSFSLVSQSGNQYSIESEECSVEGPDMKASFEVHAGRVKRIDAEERPEPLAGELYLPTASAIPPFDMVQRHLAAMEFYRLDPRAMRHPQAASARATLATDGRNIASIVRQLDERDPSRKLRIEQYLTQIVPGVRGVHTTTLNQEEALEYFQEIAGCDSGADFPSSSMSDGTLSATGVLVALFQAGVPVVPLVAVEEPESGLHPAAAGVLLDALRDASDDRQILVTSHSPELLDNKHIPPESLLVVAAEHGVTRISPLDKVSAAAVRDRLYTAGELLRMDQIIPEPTLLPKP